MHGHRGIEFAVLASVLVAAVSTAATSRPVASASLPRQLPLLNLPLVVEPGDQTAPDLEHRFLVWQDRGNGPSQVFVGKLFAGEGAPAWPSGQEQKFPLLRSGLLTFLNLMDEKMGSACRIQSCLRFVDLLSGSRWTFPNEDGIAQFAAAQEYVVQIDIIVLPGYAPGVDVRHLTNGTHVYYIAPAVGGGSFQGPVASDDWAALSLLPYRTAAPGGCFEYTQRDQCVNELGIAFLENATAVRLTNSRALYLDRAPSRWKSNCSEFDFTQEGYPAISGSMVYWQDNRKSDFVLDATKCTWSGDRWDIYGFNTTLWKEFPMRTSPWNETHPDADGHLFVWADDRNGNWDIYALNLATGEEIRVTDDPADQENPVVSDGCIAWEDRRNGNWDIYGTCLPGPVSSTPSLGKNRTGPGLSVRNRTGIPTIRLDYPGGPDNPAANQVVPVSETVFAAPTSACTEPKNASASRARLSVGR